MRSYRQYCPIAHALDLVGDRWALLVVRDLVLGPKCFSDLGHGLPGIGTNVLTDRLKGLERAGIIRRRVLPPPAASAVYELTERGHALEGVMVGLAAWGGRSLGPRRPTDSVSVDSALLALRAVFGRLGEHDRRGVFAIRIDDPAVTVGVVVDDAGVHVSRESVAAPDAVIAFGLDTLYAVASGSVSMTEAIRTGSVRIDGAPEWLAGFGGGPTTGPAPDR